MGQPQSAVAICCGFNEYKRAPLFTAVNDATQIHAELMRNPMYTRDEGVFRLSRPITDKNTKAKDILSALSDVAGTADLVWFSFSGHGRALNGELHLLLPKWNSQKDKSYAIPSSSLEAVIRKHRTKRFVLMLDACNTGAIRLTRPRKMPSTNPQRRSRRTEASLAGSGAVVLSACAQDELTDDGILNGVFTTHILETLKTYQTHGRSLGAMRLFFETSQRMEREGVSQSPVLFANGVSNDFAILEGKSSKRENESVGEGIVRLMFDVPSQLAGELRRFIESATLIKRTGRLGLMAAERQLERLAHDFFEVRNGKFVVDDFSGHVREAYANARRAVIACTTPAYFDDWRDGGGGQSLLAENERFVRVRGGKVIRFFFVSGPEFRDQYPELTNILRDHIPKGVEALVFDVQSCGRSVVRDVFSGADIDLPKHLEVAFVDNRIFLKTIFNSPGISIEVDQSAEACRRYYARWLKPMLLAPPTRVYRPAIDPENDDELLWGKPLSPTDLEAIHRYIEDTLAD